MDLLTILLTFLILTYPLGELVRISILASVSILFNDVILTTILIIWILKKGWSKQKFPFLKPVLAFIGVAFISLIINVSSLKFHEFLISGLYLVRWILYVSIYFIVVSLPKTKHIFSRILLLSGSAMVAGGYIQYFFYSDLRNLTYLGWDEHLYRMFSSFMDPNFFGIFLVLFLIFILQNIFTYKKEKKNVWALLIFAIITFFAIFLTYSRTALVMLFLTSAVLITFFYQQMKHTRKLISRFFIIGIILLTVIIIFSPRSFQTEGTNLLRTASTGARIDAISKAFTIFSDHPILGVGFNAYRYAQIRYGYLPDKHYTTLAGAGTDVSFLFILATTGIVGGVVYMYLWYSIIKRVWMIYSSEKNVYKKLEIGFFLTAVIGFLVSSLFNNSLFYPFLMEWMWIQLALMEST